jgi:subtilisin family serine protease
VAVIDSGVRSGFKLLHDSVVGGADFVDDGAPGPAADGQADWKQSSNDGHGTFVAGLSAGNGIFRVNRVMEQALQRYAPGALVGGNLPLIGAAPEAKIYAVRIFGEAGARVSDVINAINHVIEQRELYVESRGRDGFKIDVVNLSFGISTLAAGRTLLDESVDAMLQAGIVPVVAVGDSGPSTLTNLNPATSRSALTVGATSPAANERILYEVQYATQFPKEYYLGIGEDIRPYPETEVQWSSSRGPSADGRLDPDVVATGVGNISQGYCPDQILEACFKKITIGSGSSFSAPIVSGIAAVLRQAFPNATARQIQNAIIESAQIDKIASHFDVLDRGRGLPDAKKAYDLLKAGSVSDDLPALPPIETIVKTNVQNSTGLIVQSGTYGKSFVNTKPGQRAEILYEVPLYAESVRIRVHHVSMHGPQNTFYAGDRLFLYVHSARTSVGGLADYKVNEALLRNGDDREFIVTRPDVGVMRITLNPDTQNAGLVDAEVEIDTTLSPFGNPTTIVGSVESGESKLYNVTIAPGASTVQFLLRWDRDWSHYPTSDVDMVVCNPSIPSTIDDCRALGNRQGATLAAPERVSIPNPTPGNWTVVVRGFNVPLDLTEHFTLEVRQ